VEAAVIRPVLRLLFWLAAEDRGLLLDPGPAARDRFVRHDTAQRPAEDLLATATAVRDGLGEERFAAASGRLADRSPPEIIAVAVGTTETPVPPGTMDSAVPAGSGDGTPAGTAGSEPGAVEPEKQTALDVCAPDVPVC
jgi:hypothetical protein